MSDRKSRVLYRIGRVVMTYRDQALKRLAAPVLSEVEANGMSLRDKMSWVTNGVHPLLTAHTELRFLTKYVFHHPRHLRRYLLQCTLIRYVLNF